MPNFRPVVIEPLPNGDHIFKSLLDMRPQILKGQRNDLKQRHEVVHELPDEINPCFFFFVPCLRKPFEPIHYPAENIVQAERFVNDLADVADRLLDLLVHVVHALGEVLTLGSIVALGILCLDGDELQLGQSFCVLFRDSLCLHDFFGHIAKLVRVLSDDHAKPFQSFIFPHH